MRKYILGAAGVLLIGFSLFITSWRSSVDSKPVQHSISEDSLYSKYIADLYSSAELEQSGLNIAVFEKAVTGYYNLKNAGKLSSMKSIISIADMDRPSTSKRLWIIDLDKKTLLLNTWVAHGQNTGDDKATRFSNVDDSYQSSLGFYVTGEVYNGKHGRSLKLDGMDDGYNDNARKRSIVVHGAAYVSQGTINALGRLGRSQGCPAVAPELAGQVIQTIEGKTVLYINGTDQAYTSRYLNEHMAASYAGIATKTITDTTKILASAQSLKVGI
ncbi:murein L,D-transpeptidase catalytic domain family protein [Pedobacter duraquae]|uniref:L,D-transpeptidase-like protein n=1 Tax=Pedobacter duraquae TaxID=425511 RepID=A0A4R6IRC2_9SPHI|nr:murein L,D-transpeptidase catalytic domain family protein [Pedobacter duraquae]TDO24797.1 L,D-transpeptidase-like protein [Pedobacter duraquae]